MQSKTGKMGLIKRIFKGKPENFFITGCARSGTTAIANILDTASNAKVTVEESPVLHVECRALYDGVFEEPRKTFYIAKASTMDRWNSEGKIYGDKNVNYVPFIPYIDEKIIYLIRDGRDVVRSLMNWHSHFKNIYPEAEGKQPDLSDYCRPRPHPNNLYYSLWSEMSRFEMCAWYWQEWNRLGLDLLEKTKKPDQYRIVNMDTLDVNDVKMLFEWLGLKGFNEATVRGMLFGKINSLKQRFNEPNCFPSYDFWDDKVRAMFWSIAGPVYERIERLWLTRYNQTAQTLNLRLRDSPWFNLFMTESNFRIYLWIKQNISKNASILDAGAGWGSLPILLAKHGYQHCRMNDILQKRIDHSSTLAKKFGVTIDFWYGDMLKCIGTFKEELDVVTSATWQHPHYPYEKVVEHLASFLKPKGYLILTFWNEEGNIEEARQEFLKHYKYRKDFGKPFPSITPKALETLITKNGLQPIYWNLDNTPPTPNMSKMQCTTPEHIIIGQK